MAVTDQTGSEGKEGLVQEGGALVAGAQTPEAMIWTAMLRLLVRRLA